MHDDAVSALVARDKGFLNWIAVNRVWLVPLLCAMFVVTIEVGVALMGRTLPLEAHGVLGAFWLYTVGRTGQRETWNRRRQRRIVQLAHRAGIPATVAEDEHELMEMLIESYALREGGRDG